MSTGNVGPGHEANRSERLCATCHGDATATPHCFAASMNHLSVDPMPFIVSCILRCGRVCLALLVLTATVLGTATRAQGPVPITAQIAELERAVAQYEAAAKIGKPDQQKEMQYLLSVARLATLYMQVDRIQESWPLQEKMLARLEQLFGPDHPNIVSQLEANASSYGLQGRYAEAEKLRKRAIAINERAFGADSLDVAISQQGMANLFRLQERYDEAIPWSPAHKRSNTCRASGSPISSGRGMRKGGPTSIVPLRSARSALDPTIPSPAPCS